MGHVAYSVFARIHASVPNATGSPEPDIGCRSALYCFKQRLINVDNGEALYICGV